MNVEIGSKARAVSFLEIFVLNFWYSAFAVRSTKLIDDKCNHSDQENVAHVLSFSFLYDDVDDNDILIYLSDNRIF